MDSTIKESTLIDSTQIDSTLIDSTLIDSTLMTPLTQTHYPHIFEGESVRVETESFEGESVRVETVFRARQCEGRDRDDRETEG